MNMFANLLSANHSIIEIAFYRILIASLPFLILVFVFGRRESRLGRIFDARFRAEL